MSMMKEFKAFVLRGNVVDLAVAVIIGAAFNAIITSLVADLITPVLLQPALEAAGAKNIAEWSPGGILLGKFIAAVISFLLIAFVLFLIVKGVNRMKKAEPPPAPAGPTLDQQLLTEIRDLLKK